MKPWHAEIRQHIQEWSARLGARSWWPQYVYHFTDVRNAALILESGVLLSRGEAQRAGAMIVDNASPDVIRQTWPDHLEYVRLYFRPRTPTQYNNEGIRPLAARRLGGAHCPVPVFLCFDAFQVLSRDDTLFSNGNIGSHRATISLERDFFRSIPFQWVFHNGAFRPEERDEIVFRRNAEALVPHRLPLTPALKFIACRSAAERQTLLHLLPRRARLKWEPVVRIDTQGLYERKWTYVEEVITISQSSRMLIRFNPGTSQPGPFHFHLTYQERGLPVSRAFEEDFAQLPDQISIAVKDASAGVMTLRLDDCLAFQGNVFFGDIPF